MLSGLIQFKELGTSLLGRIIDKISSVPSVPNFLSYPYETPKPFQYPFPKARPDEHLPENSFIRSIGDVLHAMGFKPGFEEKFHPALHGMTDSADNLRVISWYGRINSKEGVFVNIVPKAPDPQPLEEPVPSSQAFVFGPQPAVFVSIPWIRAAEGYIEEGEYEAQHLKNKSHANASTAPITSINRPSDLDELYAAGYVHIRERSEVDAGHYGHFSMSDFGSYVQTIAQTRPSQDNIEFIHGIRRIAVNRAIPVVGNIPG